MPGNWWQVPVLREGEDELERRVAWIELFFDLAFVAVVASITGGLARHVDAATFAKSMLCFTAMWVVWRFSAIYSDRFETDDFSYRLALLGIMATAVGMAVSAGEGFDAGFRGFGFSYVAADVIVLVLWQRGARHNPRFRPLANRLAVAHVIAIAFWTTAIVIGPPIGWWIALLGLGSDFVVPFLTLPQQGGLPRLSALHLPERFGEFTIIVLGEALIALVAGLSTLSARGFVTWVAAAEVLVLITGMYWMYFDQVLWDVPPKDPFRRDVAQYLHLPLAAAIALTSAFTREFVAAPAAPFSESSRLLFSLGVAMALVSIALLDTMLAGEPIRSCVLGRSRAAEFISAGVMVAIGLFAASLPGLAVVAIGDVAVIAVIVATAARTVRGACELK